MIGVEASAVSQTATVTYDPDRTSVADLAGWVNECGYHCAGNSVPDHICHPMDDPAAGDPSMREANRQRGWRWRAPRRRRPARRGHDRAPRGTTRHDGHGGRPGDHASHAHAGDSKSTTAPSPHEAMGHGGHHGSGSMADMVCDMRNRFLLPRLLSIPITLWSPIGRERVGFQADTPFGLRDDVFALLLSLAADRSSTKPPRS